VQWYKTAYIGLGSNLGDSRAILDSAVHALSLLPATRLQVISSFYRSPPLGDYGQPDYLNAVASISTMLDPNVLLDSLLTIEREHGRVRGPQRWIARTLDLDLLVYDDFVMQTDELWLPHREMYKRDFVLVPLLEIAPGLTVPGYGKIESMVEKCPRRGLERLVEPVE